MIEYFDADFAFQNGGGLRADIRQGDITNRDVFSVLPFGDDVCKVHLDALAAHVPDLQIVAAHPSWPWQDEAIAVAQHKPNVWLELSGWSPRRIEPKLIEAVRRQFGDRTLFGTDYPFITPEQWIAAWSSLDPVPGPALTQKVLYDNAARLLAL